MNSRYLQRKVLRTAHLPAVTLVSLVLTFTCASSQTASFPFHQKEDVQHRISVFSKCLQSQRAACVAQSISAQGVTLGVDGPRITRNSLVQGLLADHKLQCLFWGNNCPPSTQCSISSELAHLNTVRIGEPRVYGKHWQVDAEAKPHGSCSTSFVFQLEGGSWRVIAISYT